MADLLKIKEYLQSCLFIYKKIKLVSLVDEWLPIYHRMSFPEAILKGKNATERANSFLWG